jgi:hypothetical protein
VIEEAVAKPTAPVVHINIGTQAESRLGQVRPRAASTEDDLLQGKKVREELATTRKGLQIISASVLIYVFFAIAGGICSAYGRSWENQYDSSVLLRDIGIIVSVMAYVLTSITCLVGQFMCLSIPAWSEARVWMNPAIFFQIVNLLLIVAELAIAQVNTTDSIILTSIVFQQLRILSSLIIVNCVALFMENVAAYMKEPSLRRSAASAVKLLWGLNAIYLLMAFIAIQLIPRFMNLAEGQRLPNRADFPVQILGCFGVVFLIVGLACLWQFMSVLQKLIKKIGHRMGGA